MTTTSPSLVRILLADDHALVRDGIRMRLEAVENFEIVGEAENGKNAVRLAKELLPDIAMMDISMPEMNGLEATRQINAKHPEIGILVLSIYDTPEYVQNVMQSGANGYILKDVSATEMIAAINAVAAGGFYFSPKVAPSLVRREEIGEGGNVYGLTGRELEVLAAIATGLSNKEIAAKLEISVRTVEAHRLNVRDKVGGGNAAHLAHVARELDLI